MQIFYTVRPGDSLSAIARRWFIPLNSLIAANNLTSPYIIYPGQQLSMPPAVTTYIVKPGDSVFSISMAYGLPINIILRANGMEPPYTITPGQILEIPEGVTYYVVRSGDTLYGIARKYNVIVNGQVKPELIIQANPGTTPNIVPGMTLIIPYPPPGGPGSLAVNLYDEVNYFLELYNPVTGAVSTLVQNITDRDSKIFWSPDRSYIAVVGGTGVITLIHISTRRVSRIDQTILPGFVGWSADSKKIVYSTGNLIRIYDVITNSFVTIDRPGTTYVQWFPNGIELLFEAKDPAGMSQLYRRNVQGSDEQKITNNSNGLLNEVRLSPNGRFVLYTSPGVSISEIYTLELATGRLYKIPGGPEAKNYYPTWSPDSTKIAYSATWYVNGKYYSQIRTTGINGQGDAMVAISSCFATPVTWSPDSRRIAYLSGCRTDAPPVEVWSVDIGKPVPLNLLSGFIFYNLAWSR